MVVLIILLLLCAAMYLLVRKLQADGYFDVRDVKFPEGGIRPGNAYEQAQYDTFMSEWLALEDTTEKTRRKTAAPKKRVKKAPATKAPAKKTAKKTAAKKAPAKKTAAKRAK